MPILQGRTRRYRKPVIIKYQILAALVGKDPASVSTVAWTVYQKYANGRPLYWQEKDGKQYGAQTQSFMWLLRSGEDGFLEIILYSYSLTRSGSHAKEFLEGCSGYLETDGCQGYNNLPGIRVVPAGHISGDTLLMLSPKVSSTITASRQCRESSTATGYSSLRILLTKSIPVIMKSGNSCVSRRKKTVLEAFWSWIDQQKPVRNTWMDKSVNYVLNRRDTAEIYLEDGSAALPIISSRM